jgi:hypothetical protein
MKRKFLPGRKGVKKVEDIFLKRRTHLFKGTSHNLTLCDLKTIFLLFNTIAQINAQQTIPLMGIIVSIASNQSNF